MKGSQLTAKPTKRGLRVKTRFYTAILSPEGGRMISLVHADAGTEFTSDRGLAEESESGYPGQMAKREWRQTLLQNNGKVFQVRFTDHGQPGGLLRWAMTFEKTFTFRAESPLITVEQSLRNAGTPQDFPELRVHHSVTPRDECVRIVPTGEGLREFAARVATHAYVRNFTEGLAALWRRDTGEAVLFLPDYDAVSHYLFYTGKEAASVEWYYRGFTVGHNAVWSSAYRLAVVTLGTPEAIPAVLAPMGITVDIFRSDQRPQAPVSVRPGVATDRPGTAEESGFRDAAAALVVREASFAAPRFITPAVLPGGAVCDRAIHTQPAAGFAVRLPDAEHIVLHATVSLREVSAVGIAAHIGCCDPKGRLHAVSGRITLTFRESRATLRLDVSDLPGKDTRLFLFGQDLLWTSVSLESEAGRQALFSALCVWTKDADDPVETDARGYRHLTFLADSPHGVPRLQYGAAPPGRKRPMRSRRMTRVAGCDIRYTARIKVLANAPLVYRVGTAGHPASVTGTVLPTGYPAGKDEPKDAVRFFVSPKGRDTFSGKLPAPNARGTDGPFATLVRARDAVRRINRSGRPVKPVVVTIRGGTYTVSRPIIFTPADSGTPDCPILYASWPGETPVISGGRQIPGPWEPAENDVCVYRFPKGRRKPPGFRQLFVNGCRETRARIPLEGCFHFGPPTGPERHTFRIEPDDLRGQEGLPGQDLVALYTWHERRFSIARVDVRKGTLTLAEPAPPERLHPMDRYTIENVPGGLKAPGAWWLDQNAGALYWHPAPGVDPNKTAAIYPATERLVAFRGRKGNPVRHVTLRGLTFAHSDWSAFDSGVQAAFRIHAAITLDHAEFCCLRDNRVIQVGTYGIGLNRGCRHVAVVGNEVTQAGAGGIRIGSAKEDPTTGCHTVLANAIHGCGQVYPSAVGLWIGRSYGNRIVRNRIHHLPYTGISVGWEWGPGPFAWRPNRIEGNEIHHVMQQLADGGGIYVVGVAYGVTVAGNLVHHVDKGHGLYLDGGARGVDVKGNRVFQCGAFGLMVQSGIDHRIENNLIADSGGSLIGLSNVYSQIAGNRFLKNIFYTGSDVPLLNCSGWIRSAIAESRQNLFYRADETPFAIEGVPGLKNLDDWIAAGIEQEPLRENPGFVDPTRGDYRLLPGSPAIALGFPVPTGSAHGPEPASCPDDVQRVLSALAKR